MKKPRQRQRCLLMRKLEQAQNRETLLSFKRGFYEYLREIQCYPSVQSSIMGRNFYSYYGKATKFGENLNIATI